MKIKKNDILSLDEFIEEALYNKKFGYYMKNDPFGVKGDFITAPNISVLFSEMIAIWVVSFWESLNCPKKFNLIELGAGNGEMMSVIINTFNEFPLFKNCCNIKILEKSKLLKTIQKKIIKNKKVKWLNNLNELNNMPCIFIANEFFDALPIKQFIKVNNKWHERHVKFNNFMKPEFIDIPSDIKKLEKKIQFKISSKQKFIEYSPSVSKYLKSITNKVKLNNGGILIIDYGHINTKMKNTLQAVSKHKYIDVLKGFRNSDITYKLNFDLIIKIIKKFGSFFIKQQHKKNF